MDGEAHVNADGCCVAYVGYGTETERHYVTGEEAKANARLIAAAPDLLSALEEMINWLVPFASLHSRAHDHARAAIVKATGGAQ
jgi:hypothetical protein